MNPGILVVGSALVPGGVSGSALDAGEIVDPAPVAGGVPGTGDGDGSPGVEEGNDSPGVEAGDGVVGSGLY